MNPSKDAPRIRLAQPGSQGANLYNAYHLLTQIASLYAQAGEADHHEHAPAVWGELCDGAMRDLGDVFGSWEQILNSKDKPAAALEEAALAAVVARACLRLDRALAAVSIWTPLAKWLTLARLAEQRWQRILTAFAAREPRIRTRLDRSRLASQDRVSRLTGLIESRGKIAQRLAQMDQMSKRIAAGEEPT